MVSESRELQTNRHHVYFTQLVPSIRAALFRNLSGGAGSAGRSGFTWRGAAREQPARVRGRGGLVPGGPADRDEDPPEDGFVSGADARLQQDGRDRAVQDARPVGRQRLLEIQRRRPAPGAAAGVYDGIEPSGVQLRAATQVRRDLQQNHIQQGEPEPTITRHHLTHHHSTHIVDV